MADRRWAMLTGGLALMIGGALLAMWLSGMPELVKYAASRGKTNTCIGVVLGAIALLLRSSARPRAPWIASVLGAVMTAIGALTLAEYALGVDLGIDQLIARDWPFAESAGYPNRMAPQAAAAFVMLGAVLALANRPSARVARLGQLIAFTVIALNGAALIGYLHNATRLYRAGQFIRLSPYTALCFVALAVGSFALRPELGIIARLRGDSIGAYLARRLLAPVVGGPIVLAWLRVVGAELGWWTDSMGDALEVLAYIGVFVGMVLYIARSLDTLDARRKLSEQELRRAFEAARLANDTARAANRAKDEFFAVLGHELRNPLAPIAVALELMRIRDPGPNRERDVIERQVRHMTRLVGDLLDVSRIAGGKVALARTQDELAEIIRDAVELMRPLVDEHHHALTIDVAPGLVVDGDRARLVQVISNLVANAAKFTPRGGAIAITARRHQDTAVLEIRDTGIGIAPVLLPRIFERFVQGEHSLDRAMGGLGLGLAIAHSLVALHGGTITAASDGEGRGATFTVSLPCASAPAVAAEPPPALATAPAPLARRVVLVDDNVDAAELLAEALELAGHSVRLAHDGQRALEVVAEFDPDCVLLDIGLPILDGYEVATRLRMRDGARHRVLIAMTGYGQANDVQRALAAGFDRHLVKPVSLEVTLELVAAAGPRATRVDQPPPAAELT